MNVYNINPSIDALIDQIEYDPETGEIVNVDLLTELEALQMEREEVMDQLCRKYFNLQSDAAAIKAEIKRLTDKMHDAEKKANTAKKQLDHLAKGEDVDFGIAKLKHRKPSAALVQDDTFAAVNYLMEHKKYQLVKTETKFSLDANAVKNLIIKEGWEIPGVSVEYRPSVTLK